MTRRLLFFWEFRFDIILSSETIYNEQLYERFHDLLDAALEPNGLVYVTAHKFSDRVTIFCLQVCWDHFVVTTRYEDY